MAHSSFLNTLWLTIALFTGTAVAADQTVTLIATRDASIYHGLPGSDTLADGSGPYLWTSVTAEGLVRRALLKFDLSAIPAGAVVRQVTLTLWESRSRGDHNIALHRLLANWGEGPANAGGSGAGAPAASGDSTWSHRIYPGTPWNTPGGEFDPVASAVQLVGSADASYSWSGALPAGGGAAPRIVIDVQSWVNAPTGNHGWIMIGNETTPQNAKRFESRNSGFDVRKPQLTLVYSEPVVVAEGDVPLPAWALVMLASMLIASGWRRFR